MARFIVMARDGSLNPDLQMRYGLLTVLRGVRRDPKRGVFLLCRCDCGNEKIVTYCNLINGNTTTCGCSRKNHPGNPKHGGVFGGKRSPEYYSWMSMNERCYRPKMKAYHHYGGRGITVCDRWRHSFAAFLKDMGKKPSPSHTLDRINNDGNYEPGNCRWASKGEQRINSRGILWVELNGVCKPISHWAKEMGVHATSVRRRYHLGIRGESLFSGLSKWSKQ